MGGGLGELCPLGWASYSKKEWRSSANATPCSSHHRMLVGTTRRGGGDLHHHHGRVHHILCQRGHLRRLRHPRLGRARLPDGRGRQLQDLTQRAAPAAHRVVRAPPWHQLAGAAPQAVTHPGNVARLTGRLCCRREMLEWGGNTVIFLLAGTIITVRAASRSAARAPLSAPALCLIHPAPHWLPRVASLPRRSKWRRAGRCKTPDTALSVHTPQRCLNSWCSSPARRRLGTTVHDNPPRSDSEALSIIWGVRCAG